MVGTEALSTRMNRQLKGALLGEDGRMKKNHRLTVLRYLTEKNIHKNEIHQHSPPRARSIGKLSQEKGAGDFQFGTKTCDS